MKKILALAFVACFLAVGSIGCNKDTKKDSGSSGGSGAKTPASSEKKEALFRWIAVQSKSRP